MLDLFCGRWGWSKAFAARGWECVGVDLAQPPEVPDGCRFSKANILKLWIDGLGRFCGLPECNFDFACASPPCEEFSVWGMKHFHPHPKYPENGIKLFNHTREILEASGVPYVMENVRAAQQFVGNAVHHCGPFYLWGNAVPPLVTTGVTKGSMIWSPRYRNMKKSQRRQEVAEIPPELANCVADYAERIIEYFRGKEQRGSLTAK